MKNFLYQLKLYLREVFVYRQLSLENVDYDEYWKSKRGENIGALSDWQKIRSNFILASIPREKFVFCDIGCGDGSILHYLESRGVLSKGIGIDTSSFALNRVKEFGFEGVKSDITQKEFLSKIPESDYSILFEILEHIPHSEEMLKSVYKKARRGVFFSFPNTGFIVHRFRLLFGRFPLQWKLFPGEHLRYWTKRDLLWWLKSLGYEDYKILYYKGVPVLNKIWPSLFAAGFVVYLKK